jgi:hypothetical protein
MEESRATLISQCGLHGSHLAFLTFAFPGQSEEGVESAESVD